MRTKFWLFLLCLLSLSVGISSCLGTDDEEREYSSDATIRAFALDTIYGQRYKFTIDNLRGEIYNEDSIPMSADTIIDRIRIDTLTCSGYITSGATDTVFSVEDSVDLRQPIQLKVHAVDGLTTRTYEVRVNRHQVDPDSMVWRHVGGHEVPGGVSDNLKAVARDGRVLTYVSATECYAIVASTLAVEGPLAVSGLPSDVSLTSITDFGGTLYVATASGEVYSSADGMAWTRSEALSGRVGQLSGQYALWFGGHVGCNRGRCRRHTPLCLDRWQRVAIGRGRSRYFPLGSHQQHDRRDRQRALPHGGCGADGCRERTHGSLVQFRRSGVGRHDQRRRCCMPFVGSAFHSLLRGKLLHIGNSFQQTLLLAHGALLAAHYGEGPFAPRFPLEE